MQKKVEDLIKEKPGYLKKSPSFIAKLIGIEDTYKNVMSIKLEMKRLRKAESSQEMSYSQERVNTFPIDKLETRKEELNKMTPEELVQIAVKHYLDANDPESAIRVIKSLNSSKMTKSNVLVIGDIHEPFTLDGYMEFCKEQYDKFKCDKVVFIGDIVDNAFSSFHPTNPDGYGAGDELDRAIDKIAKWYETFPEATVIIGNHDRLAYRKAFAGGISSRWLRTYNDVLNTPNWKFEESIEIDEVLYIHGEAGTARSKASAIGKSVVQGHLHSQAYIDFINNRVFGMQVGTGVDDSAYAFNYNKAGKESILSCGIILEGKQPLLIKK